ncbi:hypothetical protein FRX31_005606 [Thalictrum thalictroides]|uniref:Uncharacterized protein n=1 Tax=Thalictrum thalictroides TaxID=46969 RepID=A0A7J6X4T1_THATH|nr:hypothetical protein FRX31_005606 [Thalictrum thalictroides]
MGVNIVDSVIQPLCCRAGESISTIFKAVAKYLNNIRLEAELYRAWKDYLKLEHKSCITIS